jgi:methionyl aminopeptidase
VKRTKDELAKMRKAGRVVAEMHEKTRAAIRPGITTMELDRVAREVLERRGARSNFLGYHGDAAYTAPVGDISPEARKLIEVTEASLAAGIAQMLDGNRLTDISHAVQTVAEAGGYSVVREYVGHAIGTAMHEEPQVPNYGPPGKGPKLRSGMVFAIEPMVNLGRPETFLLEDGWSVVTADGSLSVHVEHTIAITDNGPEIFTVP